MNQIKTNEGFSGPEVLAAKPIEPPVQLTNPRLRSDATANPVVPPGVAAMRPAGSPTPRPSEPAQSRSATAAPMPLASSGPARTAAAPSATSPSQSRPSTPLPFGAAEIRAIKAALNEGDEALARRKDVGELHKRLVTMITTVQEGLSETQANRAAADRAELVSRLDQIERAVNGMEAALRIELEPMLRQSVQDIVAQNSSRARQSPVRVLAGLAAVLAILLMGAIYSAPINRITAAAAALIHGAGNTSISELPPEGGIATPANQVD